MGSTKVELVDDLLKESNRHNLTGEQRRGLTAIIKRAKKGYYHDFESELAMPKSQLNIDLLEIGFTGIAKKMQNGEYDDETPSPEEEERLKKLLE